MTRPRRPPTAAMLDTPEDVEAQFYEALRAGDIDALMATWLDDDEAVCVHPGGGRVVGTSAIRKSFELIFANGGVPATPEQVHRLQQPAAAVHHLVERISVMTPKGEQHAWVLATNVYLKTPMGWRMAAHHASPAGAQQPPTAMEVPSTLH